MSQMLFQQTQRETLECPESTGRAGGNQEACAYSHRHSRELESHPHTQGPGLSSKCRTKGPADPVTRGVQAPHLRSAATASLPALQGPKSALAHPAGVQVWSEAAA